jgi:FMN phosphatase YigB (HAD superfamily)
MNTIIFDFYNTLYNPKTERLFRGTYPLLFRLRKKYNLVLITTGTSNRWETITNLRLFPIFSQILICKQKNISLFKDLITSNSILIGDRQEEEILIGKKLKSRTILVNPDNENPIITIKKFLKK